MFTIYDYQELLVLHRAIMEAKFSTDPRDSALPGSAVLADISNKIVDSLIRISEDRGDSGNAQMWRKWRNAEKHGIELRAIKHNIDACNNWKEWSRAQKADYASILLSPFVFSESLLEDFVNYKKED